MPVLVGLLGLIAVAYFWVMRARNAAEMTHELAGVAGDVLAAAKRLGFRRRTNIHPVDSIEDPQLALGATALAFLELGSLPSSDDHDALLLSLQSHGGTDAKAAEETLILGRWLVSEAGGPLIGITRLAKRLAKLQGAGGLAPLMAVFNDIGTRARGGLSERQKEALQDIARIFRVQ